MSKAPKGNANIAGSSTLSPQILKDIASRLADSALPDDEAAEGDGWADAAEFLARAAAKRDASNPAILLETHSDGAERRMRLAIVNNDMPFLVDSVAGAVSAAGLSIHRIVHPVVAVRRDGEGNLLALLDKDVSGERRESLIFMELDRADARVRQSLRSEIANVLADVRAAVADWLKMQAVMQDDADRLSDLEAAALMRWFLDRNFTLLGHVECRRDGKKADALGICRNADNILLAPATVDAVFNWFERGGRIPLLIKSNQLSRVHRQVPIDLIILPVHDKDGVSALSIHAGLWTSAALSAPPEKVPVLRTILAGLLAKFEFDSSGHAGKALTHVLTALPHDLTVAADSAQIESLALTAMSIVDRPRPKLHLLTAPLQRHLFVFVWLPRDEVSTGRRVAIEQLLLARTGGKLMSWNIAMEEGGAALLRYTIDLREGAIVPDEAALDAEVEAMVRGWGPGVEAALSEQGEGRANILASRYAGLFPAAYRLTHSADEAARDIMRLAALDAEQPISVRVCPDAPVDQVGAIRLKVYSRDTALSLSQLVPALENFGFRVLEELQTSLDGGDGGHIHDLTLAGIDTALLHGDAGRTTIIEGAIAAVFDGSAENDAFNALVIQTSLLPRAVGWLRAWFRYLRQGGSPFGMATFVSALRGSGAVTEALIALFRAQHEPKSANAKAAEAARAAITTGLDAVAAIDEDRVLRSMWGVVEACLRTNAFAASSADALAFKFDSAKVPGLPKPLPWREIFVYSPRVEGIHLRAGPVARGGLRWSDRRDDYRTEILGLMKAQRVKNAVIVPTGAKGGFYPKQLPDPAKDRDAWAAEGKECYRIFIRTMLTITDNLVDGKVVHPADVVITDGEDPYFVVAADKGTATFSDVANAIAEERGFWLGDAFASGGSHGYDHKAMGITAKGAWLSVRRHFLEMGVDVQKDATRVVGVGDMSGDVFGNGMLLSKAIRLVAAFDHRHIFIDPNPDAAKSFAERQRMFNLPRSSWADYDASLISKGGGVYPRSAKSIKLSNEARAALGIEQAEIEPNALMSAILTSAVDLVWFGGIGTYLKAAAQANSDVGDPANDRIRVDAEQMRAKVVGEGANLGVTQAARIAFALGGGRINADFIDNSAGVDCSDNEVNIKIGLASAVRSGKLGADARNKLLEGMTDNVSDLVLADNRMQALALSIAQGGGSTAVPSLLRIIEQFEAEGRLDRKVEGIASNEELLRRVQDGKGLTRPELAVVLSTAKLGIQSDCEASQLGKDVLMDGELLAAFPDAMVKAHGDAVLTHQLRNEIVATKIANRVINRMGLIHPFELAEEEGVGMSDIAETFVVAEKLFDLPQLWADIDAAKISETARLNLYGEVSKRLRAHMADLIRNGVATRTLAQCVADLSPGVAALNSLTDKLLADQSRGQAAAAIAALEAEGVDKGLAKRIVHLGEIDGVVGIVALARDQKSDPAAITRAFIQLGSATGLDWAQGAASAMSPSDPWERLLVAGLARDFQQTRLDMIARLGGDAETAVADWLTRNAARISQFHAFVERARTNPAPSPAMLAQLAGQARTLLARA